MVVATAIGIEHATPRLQAFVSVVKPSAVTVGNKRIGQEGDAFPFGVAGLLPRIREKIEESLGSHLETYDAKEYNYDYFKDNKFFGGLPDGYSKEKNLIIEIKTTNVKNIEN